MRLNKNFLQVPFLECSLQLQACLQLHLYQKKDLKFRLQAHILSQSQIHTLLELHLLGQTQHGLNPHALLHPHCHDDLRHALHL